MSRRLICLGIGFIFTVTAGFAETRKITVDDAVKMAIQSNLSLESSRISLDTKRRKNTYRWNEFIPSVGVTGSLIRDNDTSTISGVGPAGPYSITAPQWHVAGNLSAQITIVTALFEGLRNYRLDYEAGLLSYEKAKTQTERDVRKQYHTILFLEDNLRVQREEYAAAERQETQAGASYRAGLAPELQFLQARVAKENLKPSLFTAENNVRNAKAGFAFALGLPYNDDFTLEPFPEEFTPVTLEASGLIADAARNKPDILELKQNILALESGRRARLLQATTPYLNISWNMQRAFTGDPFKDSWSDDTLWNKAGGLTLTLGMSFNGFFPFLKDLQGVKDMDNQIASLNINLAQLVQGTEIEVYNKCLELEQIQTGIEAMRQNVDLAGRSYQSTETAYRNGLQTLLEVQNAAKELQKARLGMFQQNVNYLNGLIDLEYSLGVPYGSLSKRK